MQLSSANNAYPHHRHFRRTSIFHVLFLLAAVLAPGMHARAQVLYGTLVGNVTDQTGAVVPGAKVTAVQLDTRDTRTAVANGEGKYTISTVPTGTYDVTVTQAGFKVYEAKGVHVALNTEVRVDIQLALGQTNETVTVNADALTLQTDRVDVHHELTTETLEELPQPTRTYEGLIGLMPGVAPPNAFSGVTNNPMQSMQIQANGTSGSGTDVRIEGISAQNPFVQYYSTDVPSVDAIQTVNVVTSTSGADQGMANGAAINVQIKSGTNQMHGSLYLYHIDNLLKARSYFLPTTSRLPKLIDNDAGGTFGGPIRRDKLFYFVSYEGRFLHNGFSNIATVPVDALRHGDMSASPTPIYDPATGAPDGTGRTAFTGNMIPASRINSPIIQKVLALIPEPNLPSTSNPSLSGNYFVNTPQYYKLQRIDTKVDWNVSSKMHVFGRFGEYPVQLRASHNLWTDPERTERECLGDWKYLCMVSLCDVHLNASPGC